MSKENAALTERVKALEAEVATKKALLEEVEDSLQIYRKRVEKMEEEYNNVSIDALHQRIQQMHSKLKLSRIQLSHMKKERKEQAAQYLRNMRNIVTKRSSSRRHSSASAYLLTPKFIDPKENGGKKGKQQ